MGMRSGTTFKKRQKEIARMEKQRDKAARRIQRKSDKEPDSGVPEEEDLLGLGLLDELSTTTPGPARARESAPASESAPARESAPVRE